MDIRIDIKVVGEVLSKLRPHVTITDETGEILWINKKLKDLLEISFKHKMNIERIFDINISNLAINDVIKIKINEDIYDLSNIKLRRESIIVFFVDSISDYYNYKVKSFCLEKIIENLNDGIVLSDKSGKLVIYNKAMEDLEKRNSNDMMNKYMWDAYGYKDINRSEHMQVFRSQTPIINKYKAHAYNNGKPIYKSYSTFPIVKDGQTIGVYSISKDETKLQSLLSETIELKRQFKGIQNDENDIKSNGTRFTFADMIGSSDVMKKLIKNAQSISWLENNILIVGSTGTGKEVLAQSIHNYGKRRLKPFIGINCSAIPQNLLESILFGTSKGAYTGAVDSSGLFEEAEEGTLFLDELDSMPKNMQSKLLRVLQEKRVRRVGGKEEYQIKCRVISSMGKDPYILIKNGKLREDLFYRVAGYNLYIPTLKERENDMFELAEYYISKNNIIMNRNVCLITDKLKRMMSNYSWHGNVRQLEHFIENTMVRTNEDDIYLRVKNVPEYILDNMMSELNENDFKLKETLPNKLQEIEKKLILKTLDKNKWNVTRTAEDLGVTRQSLNYRMRKLGIKRN